MNEIFYILLGGVLSLWDLVCIWLLQHILIRTSHSSTSQLPHVASGYRIRGWKPWGNLVCRWRISCPWLTSAQLRSAQPLTEFLRRWICPWGPATFFPPIWHSLLLSHCWGHPIWTQVRLYLNPSPDGSTLQFLPFSQSTPPGAAVMSYLCQRVNACWGIRLCHIQVWRGGSLQGWNGREGSWVRALLSCK